MNLTKTFVHKSRPIGPPIAGLQIRVHRTCWPLLPLLVFLPPFLTTPGMRAPIVATVIGLAMLGVAVFVQVAASVFMARRLGAKPAVVLLFPFGPLIGDGLASLTTSSKLAVWLAGPLVNGVGGSLLASLPGPVLDACGQLLSTFGLFSLAPCFPLPGGLILRELLGLAGNDDPDLDRWTLEISRVGLCVLGGLAVLNISLPLLYALFVLWVVAHLALVPGIDLPGVRATSVRWFKDRWTWLKEHLGRHVPLVFWLVFLWGSTMGLVQAGDAHDFKRSQDTSAPQAVSVSSLETNLLRLAVRLASLEQRLEQTTDHVAALKSAQQRCDQEGASTAARLNAAESTLTATARELTEEIERGKKTFALSIQGLATEQQQLGTAHRQLAPRVATVEAALAQLQRELQSGASHSEIRWRNLQACANQTDQALAVRDQKVWRAISALTAFAVISIAALGVAAGYFHRRIRRLAFCMERVRENPSWEAVSPSQGTACSSVGCETPGSDPEAPSIKQASGMAGSAPSAITAELNSLESSIDGPNGGGTAATIPQQPRKAILSEPRPEPVELLRRMIILAQQSTRIRAKPSTGQAGSWTIGYATSRGPLRPQNEDYALAFEIAGCQVVLVADGVSGEPFAGPAAFLAVQSAAWSVMKQLGSARLWQRPDPMAIAAQALRAAANGLARIAAGCGCVTGLKTTLIVVVAARKTYGYAYIGDGKGCILRATGAEDHFLIPQRAAADAPCVIAACLGPTLLGCPVTGTLPRRPGDLLIVGTDGAFSESVELGPDYLKRLLRAAFHFRGDLQRTVGHVLQELNSTQDQYGFLFDDNLTLALAGDGSPPRLAPGFWATKDSHGNPQGQGGKGVGAVEPLLPAAMPLPASDVRQPSVRRQS